MILQWLVTISFLNLYQQMKKVAIREQEEFKERHGLVASKAKRRKSTYVENPAELHSDDDDNRDSNAPDPKKRKKNASELSDGIPATKQITIQPKSPIKSPIKSPTKASQSNDIDEANKNKKKKKKKRDLYDVDGTH